MEDIEFALRSMACNITKKTSVSQSLEKSTLKHLPALIKLDDGYGGVAYKGS